MENLLLFFGYMFNRGFCIISIIISGIYATYYPDYITSRLPKSVPSQSAVRVYVLFNITQLLSLLIVTQTLKNVLRRQRPLYPHNQLGLEPLVPKRVGNLSDKESGTLSMPSGDTAQAANWCVLTYLFYESYFSLMIIPLVALSRVYFRCHWIGDTIIGTIIGITVA